VLFLYFEKVLALPPGQVSGANVQVMETVASCLKNVKIKENVPNCCADLWFHLQLINKSLMKQQQPERGQIFEKVPQAINLPGQVNLPDPKSRPFF